MSEENSLIVDNPEVGITPNNLDHSASSRSSGVKLDGKFEAIVPKDYPELSQDEALSFIREGKIIEHCYIRRLSLGADFSETIHMRGVYIRHLQMSEGTCHKNVIFSGCHVRNMVIESRRFNESVSMKHCKIYFMHMKNTHLHKGFNAESAEFSSKTVLQNTIFEGRVRFWEATMKDWFTFRECTFKSKVDLRSAIFEAGFTAPSCLFEGDLLFRGTHLALKWEAPDARFEKLIDFSKSKLNDFVYLEDIIQGDQQQWVFWNTVSERILVRPDQVEGRIHSEENKDHSKAMREYAVLKRSFEFENQYSYEDWAFYRFKVNERLARSQQSSTLTAKAFNLCDWFLLDWGCGYGTHPMRAIRTALVMILFFALLYTIGFSSLHQPEQLPFPDLEPNALLNRLGVSLFVSLAAFTSGFGDLREVAIGWMNAPIMIEALLGTLIWGLFIVAFGRKVIR